MKTIQKLHIFNIFIVVIIVTTISITPNIRNKGNNHHIDKKKTMNTVDCTLYINMAFLSPYSDHWNTIQM